MNLGLASPCRKKKKMVAPHMKKKKEIKKKTKYIVDLK